VLGCEGKWAIHPSQIALANDVFTPDEVVMTRARRILEAMADAARAGRGAVSLDGRLIDYASIRQAEMLRKKAELIGEGKDLLARRAVRAPPLSTVSRAAAALAPVRQPSKSARRRRPPGEASAAHAPVANHKLTKRLRKSRRSPQQKGGSGYVE